MIKRREDEIKRKKDQESEPQQDGEGDTLPQKEMQKMKQAINKVESRKNDTTTTTQKKEQWQTQKKKSNKKRQAPTQANATTQKEKVAPTQDTQKKQTGIDSESPYCAKADQANLNQSPNPHIMNLVKDNDVVSHPQNPTVVVVAKVVSGGKDGQTGEQY